VHKEELKQKCFWPTKTHIVETCGMKQRRISPVERDHVWIGAVKEDVLLILYVMRLGDIAAAAEQG